MDARMKCLICDEPLACRWTDQFGVGACLCCGAPYKILPRDQEGQSMILEEWKPILKRYWEEKHRNVEPGAYNFPGSTYEVATQEDVDSLEAWMEAHKDELPE